MKLQIFEKALCCETGVCGTDVDAELLRITSAVAELTAKGADVERANLSSKPEKFISNELIIGLIKDKGAEILPVTLLDGKVVKERIYPTNAELESWTGVKLGGGGGCACGGHGHKESKGGCGCGGHSEGHSESKKSDCGCGGHSHSQHSGESKGGCGCGGHEHGEKKGGGGGCCGGGKNGKKGCC